MNDEDLITPENVDEMLSDDKEEKQEADEEKSEEANLETETEQEADEEKSEEANLETENTSVEIGGQTYSREELEQIFHVGKSVKDYQQDHPGFDPILLHRDYTKKTKRLSELEKELASKGSVATQQPKELVTDDASLDAIAKNLGVNHEDVKTVQKIAKALGFVDASEFKNMEQQRTARDYETVKQEKINEFIAKHQEYHPAQDTDDRNWSALLDEFGLYRLPEDPAKIGVLLEKAHKVIKGIEIKPLEAGKLLAQMKVNKVGKSSSQGGAVAPLEKKDKKGIPDLALKNLKGFSDQELQDLFN